MNDGIEIENLTIPETGFCYSGHWPKGQFRGRPVRFFRVSGAGDASGIYCEMCLVLARHRAKHGKQQQAKTEIDNGRGKGDGMAIKR